MKLKILGIGVWARGIHCYDDFFDLVQSEERAAARIRDCEFTPPKPADIPPRERRRAGLMINLAVAAAHQACEHAGVDKQSIPSVFASAMGDTDITDYMCRKLAQPEKLLSPTKFHNSVHNAPSGYWSISTGNRAPSTFVGGYTESFGAGLFEASSQSMASQEPVLLVAYDIANTTPFTNVTAVDESMACALVVAPAETFAADAELDVCAQLDFQGADDVPACLPRNAGLRVLAQANPMGCALALFERIAHLDRDAAAKSSLRVPAAPDAVLRIKLSAGA